MKTKIWMCAGVLLLGSACGDKNNDSNDDNVIPGNVRPNNETNNGTNNSNNVNNGTNGSNNGTNGSNNGTNGSNNGTNGSNNGTNGSNNGTNGSNNGTNNMTLGPAETGTATVDIEITVGGRTAQMTSCDWMEGTAQAIRYTTDPTDGTIIGRLACEVTDPSNANGFFTLDMTILDQAVGINAATTMFVNCDATGCSGNAEITVGYYDLNANVEEVVSTATSMNEGGNLVIDSFDIMTAELEGDVNAVITEGPLNASLLGTFSADLADCTDRPACIGDGM